MSRLTTVNLRKRCFEMQMQFMIKKSCFRNNNKATLAKKYGFEVCLRGKASSDLKMLACLIDRFFKSTNFIKKCIVWSNHFFSNYYIHLCKIHKSWEYNKRFFFSSFWKFFTKIVTLSVCQKKKSLSDLTKMSTKC